MAESNKKLIVVLGATGAQGSPTVQYLLKHSSNLYHVRAVTRDPTKPSAQSLTALGAEVIPGDFSNESSLRTAFTGAYAIFAITNFWDQNSLELEVEQGKLINKMASEISTLQHYIFSALPDGRKIVGGKYMNILPYNAKALIREDLVGQYPRLWAKTTQLFVAYYYQNWLKYGLVFGPQKRADGTWVLSMPYPSSTRVASASSGDTGVVVDAILRGGETYHGKTVTVVGNSLPEDEKLKIWADALDIKAVFEEVTQEDYQKRMESSGLPTHLAAATAELCSALPYGEGGLEADIMVKAREIIPSSYQLKTWEDYLCERGGLVNHVVV